MRRFFGRADPGPLGQSQYLMERAWETVARKRRIALAQEALAISPDCADAYCLLAEEAAPTPEEAAHLYLQGVEAGERALGQRAFEEDVGHFWGLLETRPYMRARHGLATSLWQLGRRAEAVDHARGMLRLNPGDNLGVRHTLAAWLFELGGHTDLEELLDTYADDAFAAWPYARALLAFRAGGDSEDAREALREAVKVNPHVPPYLLGQRSLPRQRPEYMGFGDEREAMVVASEFGQSWTQTPGALAWLGMLAGSSG